MILEMLTLLALMLIWSLVAGMAFEFYTTTKENRFRFRYWFTIGMLNVFHILLAIMYKSTGDATFQEARWVAFIIIDVLMLEVFIKPVIRRRLELFVRSAFYFLLILDFMGNSPVYLLSTSIILILLSSKADCEVTKKHFTWSFVLHGVAMTVPFITGFTSALSLLAGLVYSAHLALGVKKLYDLENTAEEIQKRLILEQEEN